MDLDMERVLPIEIWSGIFAHLNVNDIQSVEQTCSHWLDITNGDRNIWKRLFNRLIAKLKNNKYTREMFSDGLLKSNGSRDVCVRLSNCAFRDAQTVLPVDDSGPLIILMENRKWHFSFSNLLLKFSFETSDNAVQDFLQMTDRIVDSSFSSVSLKRGLALMHSGELDGDEMRRCLVRQLLEKHHFASVRLVPVIEFICDYSEATSIVISAGDYETRLFLVYNRKVVKEATQVVAVGAKELVKHVSDALAWKYPSLQGIFEAEIDDHFILTNFWLNPSRDKEEDARRRCTENKSLIELKNWEGSPTNARIELGAERFLAPEMMYLKMDLVRNIEIILQQPVLRNQVPINKLILYGSVFALPFFMERLQKDIVQELNLFFTTRTISPRIALVDAFYKGFGRLNEEVTMENYVMHGEDCFEVMPT